MKEKEEEREGGSGSGGGGGGGRLLDHNETETIATGQFREGLTNTKHIEKIYLTGVYRDKYRSDGKKLFGTWPNFFVRKYFLTCGMSCSMVFFFFVFRYLSNKVERQLVQQPSLVDGYGGKTPRKIRSAYPLETPRKIRSAYPVVRI